MNRVFPNQLRKARGLLYFSPVERVVLIGVAGLLLAVANFIVALLGSVGVAAALFIHRKVDHGRYDHLEILARRKGILRKPVWSLCERDLTYERYR